MRKRCSYKRDKIINIVSIASDLKHVFDIATTSQKSALLKLLLKDCKLNGKELKYTVKAPFDKFIQSNNPTLWFNNPTQDIDLYTNIADEVKLVKEQVLLAN